MWLNVRMYVGLAPQEDLDLSRLRERIFKLLGPAIPDASGWGLLRPGILSPYLLNRIPRELRIGELEGLLGGVKIDRDWIIFDYLFSKAAKVNPLASCLKSLGLAKYGEVRLHDTYFVTVGLEPRKSGKMIFLYKGRRAAEEELDNLAYVISHMLNSPQPKKIKFDEETLAETAYTLSTSGKWSWVGWVTKEGETIPSEVVRSRWKEEYAEKLRRGDWRELRFESNSGRIRLLNTARRKAISAAIRRKIFRPGPKRELAPIFDELARMVRPHRATEVTYSMEDKAGIFRSYTERRGVVASEKFLEKEYGLSERDIKDVSYEFMGYDIDAGEWKVEVKAFRDGLTKAIEFTENEVKVMNGENGYRLFIIEDSWDEHPKVNVVKDVKALALDRGERNVTQVSIGTEIYYICHENIWRARVSKQGHSEIA